MLDHVEQRDEVERPPARALKDGLGTGAENVRQHIVIVLRSLTSFRDRSFERVQANRAKPRAELSQDRRGAATDIQRRMTVTPPSHLPDVIFNAMRGDETAKEVVCPPDHTLVGRTEAAASALARQEESAGLLDSYQARSLNNWCSNSGRFRVGSKLRSTASLASVGRTFTARPQALPISRSTSHLDIAGQVAA